MITSNITEDWTDEEKVALKKWEEEKRVRDEEWRLRDEKFQGQKRNYVKPIFKSPNPPTEDLHYTIFRVITENRMRLLQCNKFAAEWTTLFGDTDGVQVSRQSDGSWDGVIFRIGFGEHTKKVNYATDDELMNSFPSNTLHSVYHYDGEKF